MKELTGPALTCLTRTLPIVLLRRCLARGRGTPGRQAAEPGQVHLRQSVFLAPKLDGLFPLASLQAETSLGSGHTPLIFNSSEGALVHSNWFFFKTGWFEVEGFLELVHAKWHFLASVAGGRDIID